MPDFEYLDNLITNLELTVEDVQREYQGGDEGIGDAVITYDQIAQDQELFRSEFDKWFNRRHNLSKEDLVPVHEFYQKHLFDLGWHEIAAEKIFREIIDELQEGS